MRLKEAKRHTEINVSPATHSQNTPNTATNTVFIHKGISIDPWFLIMIYFFYSFNWKTVPTENFQLLHIKKMFSKDHQHLEVVKIYFCSQNICKPQWRFGSLCYTCLPVQTQENGNFSSTLVQSYNLGQK